MYKPQSPGLTSNQKAVLEALVKHFRIRDVPPTLADIAASLSTSLSVRGIVLQLKALERMQYLVRYTGQHRGIYLSPSLLNSNRNEQIQIPLMIATVPCGEPVEAYQESDEKVTVSTSETRGISNAIAVKTSGDSMIDAGIEDGDIAIIAPQQVAEDGDIVIAYVEDRGVTLKKFRNIEGHSMLIPANPNFVPITDAFRIQGRLVGLIKERNSKHRVHLVD